MDPNACLLRFLEALDDNEAHEAWDAHLDLEVWLSRGGFEPADKEGLARFKRWVRLDRFTSVGSYPLVYLRADGIPLCPACAAIEGIEPHCCDIHWEGDPIDCEECGEGIASAYGSAEIADERTDEDLADSVE